ncbi:hypothetical protein ACHAWF_015259, partial [Thalassiosira exigua]
VPSRSSSVDAFRSAAAASSNPPSAAGGIERPRSSQPSRRAGWSAMGSDRTRRRRSAPRPSSSPSPSGEAPQHAPASGASASAGSTPARSAGGEVAPRGEEAASEVDPPSSPPPSQRTEASRKADGRWGVVILRLRLM